MTTRRESDVERVCQAALDCASADRAAFLDRACGGDAALRREVEALLAHASAAERFIESPAVDVAAQEIAAAAAVRIGERLGPYEVTGTLGAGGMGEVYRARDSHLGRDVAIKILPTIFLADPGRLSRFEREARVLASLNHPNIAAIYAVEPIGIARALVLELVEGPTLAERLARGSLPAPDALAVATQIAGALEAAHEKGIVHRDLKPANIKLRPDGTVKVLDFGLAKTAVGDGSTPDLTKSPTVSVGDTGDRVVGTPAYMSPEQARGQTVDKRTDIWAFGCVLFEMLTGQPAFAGPTTTDTLAAIIERDPDWGALSAATPPGLQRLMRRCLQKDSKRRLHDIADARIEIDDALAEGTGSQQSPVAAKQNRILTLTFAWSVAGLAAVIAIAAAILLRPAAADRTVTRLDLVTPPTHDPVSLALSADGRQLAFVGSSGDGSALWLRSLDQATARPLPDTEDARYPFWAPDGRSIGFFAGGKLKRVDLPSGRPQDIADAPTARGGTWSQAGVIIFNPIATGGLMQVPATGGTVRPVNDGNFAQSRRWPRFLPDGHRFLFFVDGPRASETRGIYMGSLDGNSPVRIVDADAGASFAPPDKLLILRQGVLVALRMDPDSATVSTDSTQVASNVVFDSVSRGAFDVSTRGVLVYRAGAPEHRQLVWRDRSGRALGTVGPLDGLGVEGPALSPDDQRIAITMTRQGNDDIWLLDARRGVPNRFTFDPGIDSFPIWARNGQSVVFSSTRNPRGLFEKPATGMVEEQQIFSGNALAQDWTPNGPTVLYQSVSKTGSDLWAISLNEGAKPFPVAQTPFQESLGQFSPDGRWVAYQSNESNQFEIYVQSFPRATSKSLISTGGGTQPRWRRDGKELFYLARDGQMMAVPLAPLANGQSVEPGPAMALFPAGLAVAGSLNVVAEPNLRHQYAVASDGRFLLNTRVEEATPPPLITVVLNWNADQKK